MAINEQVIYVFFVPFPVLTSWLFFHSPLHQPETNCMKTLDYFIFLLELSWVLPDLYLASPPHCQPSSCTSLSCPAAYKPCPTITFGYKMFATYHSLLLQFTCSSFSLPGTDIPCFCNSFPFVLTFWLHLCCVSFHLPILLQRLLLCLHFFKDFFYIFISIILSRLIKHAYLICYKWNSSWDASNRPMPGWSCRVCACGESSRCRTKS